MSTEIVNYDLVPCSICGGGAEMVVDEYGYSVIHPCINMSTRVVFNQPTPEKAALEWRRMF